MRNILVILDNDIINVMMEMNRVIEAPRHRPELMGYTLGKLKEWAYDHNGNVYEQTSLLTQEDIQ